MIKKKDLQALARALDEAEAGPHIVLAVAQVCAASNPNFYRARFVRACGCRPGIYGLERGHRTGQGVGDDDFDEDENPL